MDWALSLLDDGATVFEGFGRDELGEHTDLNLRTPALGPMLRHGPRGSTTGGTRLAAAKVAIACAYLGGIEVVEHYTTFPFAKAASKQRATRAVVDATAEGQQAVADAAGRVIEAAYACGVSRPGAAAAAKACGDILVLTTLETANDNEPKASPLSTMSQGDLERWATCFAATGKGRTCAIGEALGLVPPQYSQAATGPATLDAGLRCFAEHVLKRLPAATTLLKMDRLHGAGVTLTRAIAESVLRQAGISWTDADGHAEQAVVAPVATVEPVSTHDQPPEDSDTTAAPWPCPGLVASLLDTLGSQLLTSSALATLVPLAASKVLVGKPRSEVFQLAVVWLDAGVAQAASTALDVEAQRSQVDSIDTAPTVAAALRLLAFALRQSTDDVTAVGAVAARARSLLSRVLVDLNSRALSQLALGCLFDDKFSDFMAEALFHQSRGAVADDTTADRVGGEALHASIVDDGVKALHSSIQAQHWRSVAGWWLGLKSAHSARVGKWVTNQSLLWAEWRDTAVALAACLANGSIDRDDAVSVSDALAELLTVFTGDVFSSRRPEAHASWQAMVGGALEVLPPGVATPVLVGACKMLMDVQGSTAGDIARSLVAMQPGPRPADSLARLYAAAVVTFSNLNQAQPEDESHKDWVVAMGRIVKGLGQHAASCTSSAASGTGAGAGVGAGAGARALPHPGIQLPECGAPGGQPGTWYRQAVALVVTAHTWRGHVLNNAAGESMLALLVGMHTSPSQQTKQSLETALKLWLHPQLLLSWNLDWVHLCNPSATTGLGTSIAHGVGALLGQAVVLGAESAATLIAAVTHKFVTGEELTMDKDHFAALMAIMSRPHESREAQPVAAAVPYESLEAHEALYQAILLGSVAVALEKATPSEDDRARVFTALQATRRALAGFDEDIRQRAHAALNPS